MTDKPKEQLTREEAIKAYSLLTRDLLAEILFRTREELERTQATLMEVEAAKISTHNQWWSLHQEIEQVKESRDEWEKGYNRKTLRCVWAEAEVEYLRTELSAKDKVLESIANLTPGFGMVTHAVNMAETILSQYRRQENE